MALVQIPGRLAGEWSSPLPPAVDAAMESEWGRAIVGLGVDLAQSTAARVFAAVPVTARVADAASDLLDIAPTVTQLARAIQGRTDPFGAVQASQDAVWKAFESLSRITGIATSVPVIGMIAQIGLIAQRAFFRSIARKVEDFQAVTDAPWSYDRDSDEHWTRLALAEIEARDLTGIFLPRTTPDRLIMDRVKRYGGSGGYQMRWQVEGQPWGLGAVPGTGIIARGWQRSHPWSRYRPAANMQATLAWQMLMTTGPNCMLADASEIATAWDEWGDVVRGAVVAPEASALPGAARDRWRGNIWEVRQAWAGIEYLPEPVTRPNGTLRQCTWLPSYQFFSGQVPTFSRTGKVGSPSECSVTFNENGMDVAAFGAWAAMNLLRPRQRAALDRYTVAYCSESDPAFRSDPGLAELLRSRRELLLSRPRDLWRLDLGGIVDSDYRSAVANARPKTAPDLTARVPSRPLPDASDPIPSAPKKVPLPSLPVPTVPGIPPVGQGSGALALAAVAALAIL